MARVRSPAGLDLVSWRQEEIAVAILAELVAWRHTRDGDTAGLDEAVDTRGQGRGTVRLENSFEVPASPETAWDLLMDVPRVVPCMPGAELTETVDDSHWKAKMAVKLGPISLNFATDVERKEADEAARRVTLGARARELRGRGAAQATIESSLEGVESGTRIDIVSDVKLSGAVAQYGRGMVQDVSAQLVGQFADCLEAQLGDQPGQAEAAATRQSKPVSGLSLGLRALWRAIVRLFRREKN